MNENLDIGSTGNKVRYMPNPRRQVSPVLRCRQATGWGPRWQGEFVDEVQGSFF